MTVAKAGVVQPSQWIDVDPFASLSGGVPLDARQEAGSAVSPSVSSLPIAEVNREINLPAPGLVQPVTACRTSIHFFGMFPSADVTIENEGQSATWFDVAPAFNARAPLLSARESW